MNVIATESKFKTVADIVITYDDQTAQTTTVQEGDIIKISYVKETSLPEFQGKILEINPEENIIVIDGSEEYRSNIVRINIANIRSIEKI